MLSRDSEDKMGCDLCLKFDLKKLLWQDELNPRVRCAFGNVSFISVFEILPNINTNATQVWEIMPIRIG